MSAGVHACPAGATARSSGTTKGPDPLEGSGLFALSLRAVCLGLGTVAAVDVLWDDENECELWPPEVVVADEMALDAWEKLFGHLLAACAARLGGRMVEETGRQPFVALDDGVVVRSQSYWPDRIGNRGDERVVGHVVVFVEKPSVDAACVASVAIVRNVADEAVELRAVSRAGRPVVGDELAAVALGIAEDAVAGSVVTRPDVAELTAAIRHALV